LKNGDKVSPGFNLVDSCT